MYSRTKAPPKVCEHTMDEVLDEVQEQAPKLTVFVEPGHLTVVHHSAIGMKSPSVWDYIHRKSSALAQYLPAG